MHPIARGILLAVAFLATACGDASDARGQRTEARRQGTEPRQKLPANVLAPPLTPRDRSELFQEIWNTINRQYYDPTFQGTAWSSALARYGPRVEAAHDDSVFYDVIDAMLSELKDPRTVFNRPTGPLRPDGTMMAPASPIVRTSSPGQRFASRRLESGTAYIRFTDWKSPVDAQVAKAVAANADAPGMIIDLRGNAGGYTIQLQRIASLFLSDGTFLGVYRKRTPAEPSCVRPNCGGAARRNERTADTLYARAEQKVYDGPVVLLVDGASAGASEVFTAVMSSLKRATVVGTRTCGCAINQWTRPMFGNGTLRWSAREFISPLGRMLELSGLTPDRAVPLQTGGDAALDAALEIIRTSAHR